MVNVVFSEQDQNVRKWWFRIFLMQIVFGFFSMIYQFPYDIATTASTQTFIIAMVSTSLGLLLSLLWNYALYYCGYKKQGTKLLTIMLILIWCGFLTFGIQLFSTLLAIIMGKPISFSLFAKDRSISDYLLILAAWALSFPAYIFTVRLRRINKASNTIPKK